MKFTVSQVVSVFHQDAVWVETTRLSGSNPGSRTWLASYRKALSNIRKELSEKELEAIMDKKDEMEAGDIPRDMQGR